MLFNKARAADYMKRCELDALVATSPINITYFSGYYCWVDALMKEYMMVPGGTSRLSQAYAVVPAEGEAALVVSPLFAANAADVWIQDIHLFGDAGLDHSLLPVTMDEKSKRIYDLHRQAGKHATPTDALLSILGERGLSDARIGLEMDGLPSDTVEEIVRRLPQASIGDCSNTIRLIRMVKTEDEMRRLERATQISEIAAMQSLTLAKPGRLMAEIAQHYRRRVAELGADFDHFAFGLRGMGIATEPEYVLSGDEVTYVDFGCKFQHYFADGGTALAMCEPPPVFAGRYAALSDCVSAGLAAIRPGAKSSSVREAMWRTLADRNITAANPHGHGTGLEIRDYPIIVADNSLRIRDACVDIASDIVLEAGMVVNLEVPLFMAGAGSLHIEQTFVIKEEGCQPLVQQDRSSPIRGA
jgi:Xaa-Pro aminopeptidase